MSYVINEVGKAAGIAFLANTTNYVALNGIINLNTTEANVQGTFNSSGGNFDKGGVFVSANSVALNSTVSLRANGVTKTVSITITASTTGLFEDTNNSFSIVTTDKINWIVSIPNNGTSVTIRNLFCRFSSSVNTFQKMLARDDGASTYGSTTVNYLNLGADMDLGTTEAKIQYTFRTIGTLKNGLVYLSTNTRDSTTTVKSRKNTADGNIAVSLTASTSGIFEDTVNSDSVVAGDLINMSIQGTTGSGSMNLALSGMEFVTTNNKSEAFMNNNAATSFTLNTTFFPGLTGGTDSTAATTEARTRYKASFPFNATNLKIYVTNNLSATNDTFDFRIDGVSSALTVSITALTSGLFEDVTNTASIVIGNLVNYRLVVGTTGNTSASQFGCLIVDTTIFQSLVSITQPYKDKVEMVDYGY